jgi:hypothetical protein
MNVKLLAVVGVLSLVAAGVLGAFATGFGPAPGGDSGSDVESFPTATPAETAGGDGAGETATATTADGDGAGETATPTATTATTPPFTFSIDSIEECGRTCRDVTSTLTNRQDATAENVTVYTRVFVGNGTDGDVVWEGSEPVGTLDAGESYTATRRVELSYSDALTIQQSGGWITVQTTVQTDDRTVTFSDQRQVA